VRTEYVTNKVFVDLTNAEVRILIEANTEPIIVTFRQPNSFRLKILTWITSYVRMVKKCPVNFPIYIKKS